MQILVTIRKVPIVPTEPVAGLTILEVPNALPDVIDSETRQPLVNRLCVTQDHIFVPLYVHRINPGPPNPTMGIFLPFPGMHLAQADRSIRPRLQLRMGVLPDGHGQGLGGGTASRLQFPSVELAPGFQLKALCRAVLMPDLRLGSQEGH